MNKNEYYKNPKLCLLCGKVIDYKKRLNKFCGHTCSAKVTNKERTKKKLCLECGAEMSGHSKYKCKFCSHTCHKKYRNKEFIKLWKSNKINVISEYGELNKQVRAYIFDKYKNKCSICGWCEVNKTTNKVPLQVNHIDGIHTNNKEENLELLCPNCHSLTPNYGSLNKGNGRKRKGC